MKTKLIPNKQEPPEKKKQTPKPPILPVTWWILANYMSFLNLSFAQSDWTEILNAIMPDLQWLTLLEPEEIKNRIEAQQLTSAEKDKAITFLAELQENLKEMIRIANGEKSTKTAKLETWIMLALAPLKPYASWGKEGNTVVKLHGNIDLSFSFVDSWLPIIRGNMVWIIGESFSSRYGETANGLFFIGSCPKPKCLKIFSKKTQRQIFCSPSCQEALKQDRHRRKKKNT